MEKKLSQTKQQLKEEINRHQQIVQYLQQQLEEEYQRHQRVQNRLEEQLKLLQDPKEDDEYWLNNIPAVVPQTARQPTERLTKEEKLSIKQRVKRWAKRLQRR